MADPTVEMELQHGLAWGYVRNRTDGGKESGSNGRSTEDEGHQGFNSNERVKLDAFKAVFTHCSPQQVHQSHLIDPGDKKMKIEERQVGDTVILDAIGRMTLGDGDQLFKDKIYSLVHRGQRNVVLNLGGVSYLDSAGLGAIVASYTTLTRAGGRLGLLNLTRRIENLFMITKLLTVFDTYTSEAEALRSFVVKV